MLNFNCLRNYVESSTLKTFRHTVYSVLFLIPLIYNITTKDIVGSIISGLVYLVFILVETKMKCFPGVKCYFKKSTYSELYNSFVTLLGFNKICKEYETEAKPLREEIANRPNKILHGNPLHEDGRRPTPLETEINDQLNKILQSEMDDRTPSRPSPFEIEINDQLNQTLQAEMDEYSSTNIKDVL